MVLIFILIKIESNFYLKKKNGWYSFYIYRSSTWNKGTESYDSEIEINTSSGNGSDKNYLKKLQCLGILAFNYENKSDKWNSIVEIMNDALYFDKNEIRDFWNKTSEIEAQIKKIEQEEKDQLVTSIFNKGELKLNKSVQFYYGCGKYDYGHGKNFYCTINKSGKTAVMDGEDEIRTNPHWDDSGERIEPIYELTRSKLSDRVKVKDIKSLIEDQIKNLAS